MSEIGADELNWPPDLSPIKYLWDELEQKLRARPSHPTSVPDLIKALLEKRSNIPIVIIQYDNRQTVSTSFPLNEKRLILPENFQGTESVPKNIFFASSYILVC